MREDELKSSNAPTSKKISKSRRRLHEAEVLSTTPCTAPLRRPQQDSTNRRFSLRDSALDENQLPHLHSSSVNSSVEGAADEYNRISNKTGGFEGALPLQYDAIFPKDDNTAYFDATVKSSPELGKGGRYMNGGRDTATTRRRLFQRHRRTSDVDCNDATQKVGFFQRWIGSKNEQNTSFMSVGNMSRSTAKQQNATEIRPPKLRLSSREVTTVTVEDSSEKSATRSHRRIATPSRDTPFGSPRFILPDETPPGSVSSRNKAGRSKESTSDHTSAAVAAKRSLSGQLSEEHGFEMSISSAPPTYSTPRKQRTSIPVDLDEVDGESSSDGSTIEKLFLQGIEHQTGARKASLSPNRRRIFNLSTLSHQQSTKQPSSGNRSGRRPASLSPNRKRLPSLNTSNKEGTKQSVPVSRSAHTRLGMNINSDDEVSKFSADHLGAMESTTRSIRRQQSSESDLSTTGYAGFKKWILPTNRKNHHTAPAPVALEQEQNALVSQRRDQAINGSKIVIKSNYERSDELQSLSPDQRESIFANMELVEKESIAGEYERRSTLKSTNYTQSTTSSSKDAVRLPQCVVCNFYDRTHIAVPCMHFAYCRECSMRLAKLRKGCVLCNNQHVTFAAVSV
jgi:Zinc finger, C3HC4 type (RING finger)